MKNMIVITMIGVILAVILVAMPAVSSRSIDPSVSVMTADIHNINAQIYGDPNVTGGFPAYLTNQSPSAVMPQASYIVARSPGNSTLTVEINGTYAYRDLMFNSITQQPLSLPLKTSQITIVITSYTMNYTRIFRYSADGMTATQFITYAEDHYVHQPNNTFTLAEGIIEILYTVLGTASGIMIGTFVIFIIRSNPNIEKWRVT